MEPAAPDIAKTRAEHDEILALIGELERALTEPTPPPGLAELRRELAVKVRAHLHYEDWVIYPWLLANESEAIASTARRLFAEMNDHAAGVAAHIARWPMERVMVDWEGYRRATLPVTAQFRMRTEAENEGLYRLLLEERDGEAA